MREMLSMEKLCWWPSLKIMTIELTIQMRGRGLLGGSVSSGYKDSNKCKDCPLVTHGFPRKTTRNIENAFH